MPTPPCTIYPPQMDALPDMLPAAGEREALAATGTDGKPMPVKRQKFPWPITLAHIGRFPDLDKLRRKQAD